MPQSSRFFSIWHQKFIEKFSIPASPFVFPANFRLNLPNSTVFIIILTSFYGMKNKKVVRYRFSHHQSLDFRRNVRFVGKKLLDFSGRFNVSHAWRVASFQDGLYAKCNKSIKLIPHNNKMAINKSHKCTCPQFSRLFKCFFGDVIVGRGGRLRGNCVNKC